MRWLPLVFLTLCACQKEGEPVRRAVYHWESNLALEEEELAWMHNLGIGRIYLRLFDIDRPEGEEPAPVGVLEAGQSPAALTEEIVPTFFITNRTFENLPEVQSDTLAARLVRKARFKLREQLGDPPVREWQFDCDWTEGTREAYFRFLENVSDILSRENVLLSATIRLHQVKYFRRTGVPPVSRGMLMFYNMDDVSKPETANSILDLKVARAYYENFDAYPLPLDLALPLFRWGVVLREGRMVRIINDLGAEALNDTSRFVFRDASRLGVKKSTYLDGYYLYREDEIRLEAAAAADLAEAAKDLSKILARPPGWVSFYQLSPAMTKRYSHEELETICKILEE